MTKHPKRTKTKAERISLPLTMLLTNRKTAIKTEIPPAVKTAAVQETEAVQTEIILPAALEARTAAILTLKKPKL